jgi:threonine aldolase
MAISVPTRPSSAIDAALRLDFRSDTFTQPTDAMREAMSNAEVGDDVFGEDPSINALEAEAARIFAKEAAVFVASGTQGNLLALLSLTRPGDEVIVETTSHIANWRLACRRLGGLTLRPSWARWQDLTAQVAATVRPDNVHFAIRRCWRSRTPQRRRRTVRLPNELAVLANIAHERGLRVHADGKGIFNAAVALGEDPSAFRAAPTR